MQTLQLGRNLSHESHSTTFRRHYIDSACRKRARLCANLGQCRSTGCDCAARVLFPNGFRARSRSGTEVLQEIHRCERHACCGVGRSGRPGLAAHLLHRHPHAGRPARRYRGHGQEPHVSDHHRQGPGLHRYARVPEQPKSGISKRAGARHGRQAHQFRRREPAQPVSRPL